MGHLQYLWDDVEEAWMVVELFERTASSMIQTLRRTFAWVDLRDLVRMINLYCWLVPLYRLGWSHERRPLHVE